VWIRAPIGGCRTGQKNGIGNPAANYAVGAKYMEISGFHTTGQWRKTFFLAFCHCCGKKRGSRGTEAVKLSAKLLSGLALIALISVAVVGLSPRADAAVDGKVYVTNVFTNMTTEAGQVSTGTLGRTTAATVYGTYASAVTTGTTARDIATKSNQILVTVLDADVNTTVDVTSDAGTGASTGYDMDDAWTASDNVTQGFGSGFAAVGDQVRVTFEDVTKPIVGSASTIVAYVTGTDTLITATLNIVINENGNGTTKLPIIDVSVGGGTVSTRLMDFRYKSSAKDVITASVKSVVDTTGSVVVLTETGFDSGRFEGYVQVNERTATVTQGTGGNYCPATSELVRPDLRAGAWDPTVCIGNTLGAAASPATIPATAGPITISYKDAVTSGTATNVAITATYNIDVTTPTLTFTAPVTASASQSRLPTFTGSFTDNESGVDVSSFELRVDNDADSATNAVHVLTPGASDTSADVATGGEQSADLQSVTLTGITDGTKTFTFTKTVTGTLPNGVTNPDHIVDFQARASDLAGNYGYTDADAASALAGNVANKGGRHGNQPHTIRIDQVLPSISSAEAGSGFDETLACCTAKVNVRDMVKVTFDGKLNADSVAATDFSVVLDGTGGTFVPANVTVKDDVVYLDIDSTIPSNDTPAIKLVGTVQDLAGNSSSAGTTNALDKLSPVVTVVYSGGSGTGAAGS